MMREIENQVAPPFYIPPLLVSAWLLSWHTWTEFKTSEDRKSFISLFLLSWGLHSIQEYQKAPQKGKYQLNIIQSINGCYSKYLNNI